MGMEAATWMRVTMNAMTSKQVKGKLLLDFVCFFPLAEIRCWRCDESLIEHATCCVVACARLRPQTHRSGWCCLHLQKPGYKRNLKCTVLLFTDTHKIGFVNIGREWIEYLHQVIPYESFTSSKIIKLHTLPYSKSFERSFFASRSGSFGSVMEMSSSSKAGMTLDAE